MKTTKKLLSFLLAIFILTISTVPIYAANDNITPRYNNTAIVETSFVIDDNGVAWVSAMYNGYIGITTGAKITIKLEKKFLWWWNDVDNGCADNTYVKEFTGDFDSLSYSLQLSKTGKYRATVVYTIYGTAGDPDVITYTGECEY